MQLFHLQRMVLHALAEQKEEGQCRKAGGHQQGNFYSVTIFLRNKREEFMFMGVVVVHVHRCRHIVLLVWLT